MAEAETLTGPVAFSNGPFATITQNPNPSLTIGNLVTIKSDGTIICHEGYTPDAAAKAFWDAMGLERKERV